MQKDPKVQKYNLKKKEGAKLKKKEAPSNVTTK